MRLHAPMLEIPPEDPYAHDLFERKQFGDSLASLFCSVEESIVLCVNAPWGDGKTTFARMWIADLKNRGMNCIYYDAYEHDYSDDSFISFCAEIVSLAETVFDQDEAIQTLKDDFKTRATRIGGKLLRTGTRIAVKGLTAGLVGDSDIDALESIKNDLASSSLADTSALVERAMADYVSTKKSLTEFRQKLAALGAAVRTTQQLPLLLVVDELDRCRPDFALSLIERIKHLFTTDNVSFLLLANMDQLENYVRTVYGADVDARNYLYKFLALSTRLPKNVQDRLDNDYTKYVCRLAEHHRVGERRDLRYALVRLFQNYAFTLREMERCFSTLALYYSQLPPNWLTDDVVIAFLCVLKIRWPGVFDELAAGRLAYEALAVATGIEKMEEANHQPFNKDWFLAKLKYLLFTDEEYKALDKHDEIRSYEGWLVKYDMDRTRVMPFFCEELSRFRLEAP